MDWTGRGLESDSFGQGRAASSTNELKSLAGRESREVYSLGFLAPKTRVVFRPLTQVTQGKLAAPLQDPGQMWGGEGQLQHWTSCSSLTPNDLFIPGPKCLSLSELPHLVSSLLPTIPTTTTLSPLGLLSPLAFYFFLSVAL